jgi:diadenosine tetraphosphate (Ap4A) HIT family hydrolase
MPMLVEGCFSCDVLRGTVVPPGGFIYQDTYWAVSHGMNPIAVPGWLIVAPRRHCEHIAELTAEEMAAFGPLLRQTSRALTRVVQPAKIHIYSMGEVVKHVHFYVMPRYEWMPASGLAVLEQAFRARRWECSEAEAAAVADQVRAELLQLITE